MICPNCQTENSDTTKFCSECGTPLKQEKSSDDVNISDMPAENTDNEIIGSSYSFSRQLWGKIKRRLLVEFEENCLKIGLIKPKRIPYNEISAIHTAEKINMYELYIIIIMLVAAIVLAVSGKFPFMCLVLLVCVLYSLTIKKTDVISIVRNNGKTYKIKMDKEDKIGLHLDLDYSIDRFYLVNNDDKKKQFISNLKKMAGNSTLSSNLDSSNVQLSNNSSKKLPVIIIAISVVILLVGIAAFFGFKTINDDSDNMDNSEAVTVTESANTPDTHVEHETADISTKITDSRDMKSSTTREKNTDQIYVDDNKETVVEDEALKGRVIISDSYLNVRDKPDSSGKVIAKLKNNAIVTIENVFVDDNFDWFEITTSDNVNGYVSSDSLDCPFIQYLAYAYDVYEASGGYEYGMLSFYDVDKDGTTEMILQTGMGEADASYDFYTAENGNAVYLGSVGAAHSTLFEADDGTLVIQMAHMGGETVTSVEIVNGKLVTDKIYSSDGMVQEYSTPGTPIEHYALGEIFEGGEEDPAEDDDYIMIPINFKGEINCHGGIVSGYTLSYLQGDNSDIYVRRSLGDTWHITAKNTYKRRDLTGIIWYELWDTDDGDYYGWVDSNYIDFYSD